MKIQEVIGEDKYVDQLDSDINSTIITMMANDIDEIGNNPGGHFKLGLAIGRRF